MNRIWVLLIVAAIGIAGTVFFWKMSSTNSNATHSQPAIPAIPSESQAPVNYTYEIINTYYHDPNAFTQGLIYDKDLMYEGTGLYGESTLRKVEFPSGKVLQSQNLDSKYFGEGLTLWQDKLIQLTWVSQIGFIYDKESFKLLNTFKYSTEGWGITHDKKRLIMSDGTANLYFFDPETLAEIGRLQVTDRGTPVARLNELEFINGFVFANIWQTDFIAICSGPLKLALPHVSCYVE